MWICKYGLMRFGHNPNWCNILLDNYVHFFKIPFSKKKKMTSYAENRSKDLDWKSAQNSCRENFVVESVLFGFWGSSNTANLLNSTQHKTTQLNFLVSAFTSLALRLHVDMQNVSLMNCRMHFQYFGQSWTLSNPVEILYAILVTVIKIVAWSWLFSFRYNQSQQTK